MWLAQTDHQARLDWMASIDKIAAEPSERLLFGDAGVQSMLRVGRSRWSAALRIE
jgi:hypothetical protein